MKKEVAGPCFETVPVDLESSNKLTTQLASVILATTQIVELVYEKEYHFQSTYLFIGINLYEILENKLANSKL